MYKKYLTPKNILLLILAIFIVAISWRFFDLLSFRDSSIVLEKGEIVKIKSDGSLTQKFMANRDGLAKVEVLLRSPGIKYENGDKMEMAIKDENCEKIIREGRLEDAFLSDNNLYEFRFPRISDSSGKTYCLTATFKPKKDNAKAIQFFTMGIQENQLLSIRPVYKNSNIFQDFSELNKRMSQYKPWFLKHYYLWTITILFIFLSLVLIVALILV